MSGRWRLLAWTAALVLGLRALHALGAGTLGVPLDSAEELSAWLDRTPPELMALALVRLAALATGWYLAVCTIALALSRPFGRTRVVAAAVRATPGVVRRIVSGGGSLGLAAGTLLGALPAGTVAALAPTPAAASLAGPTQDPGPATATMTRSGRDVPTAVMIRLPADGAPAARAASGPDPAPVAAAPPSWTVEAGDSFWSIAVETVSPTGDEPSDRQVVGYWRRLVEANRSRLLHPGNPDLLVPGQELLLPDPVG
ncbi:MAG: LysM peptidoglycan-binding domain-containing protein [Acidimicrobiales bacterium]